jgi:hypothetical protein
MYDFKQKYMIEPFGDTGTCLMDEAQWSAVWRTSSKRLAKWWERTQ